MINSLSIIICFTGRNFFKMARTILQKWLTKYKGFCQKGQNFVKFGSSDFIQFCQLMVTIVSKQLHIVISYTVSNSNGNLKLEA